MTIESLIHEYPRDESFAGNITGLPEFQKGKSKIIALANVYYREGRDGLLVMERKLTREGVTFSSTGPSRNLTVLETRIVNTNRAAVMLGSLVPTFEEMLVEGVYDPIALENRYAAGFTGTGWPRKLYLHSRVVRVIGPGEMADLRALVKDKTFAGFLTDEGIDKLPLELGSTIRNSGNKQYIQKLLPIYKEMGDLLLGVAKPQS